MWCSHLLNQKRPEAVMNKPDMGAPEEKTTSKRRPPGNKVVLRAGRGGDSGGLLLLGGALVTAAALGVAFVFRPATKRKKTEGREESPHETEQEKRGADTITTTTTTNEGKADEGENRSEGLRSVLLPPPAVAQVSPPSPPPLPPPPPAAQLHVVAKGAEDSRPDHGQAPNDQNPSATPESVAGDFSAAAVEDVIVEEPGFVQVNSVVEKIIEESTSTEGGQEQEHGRRQQGEEKDLFPGIVNKDVVIDESKVIQVVEVVALEQVTPTGGCEGEEKEEEGGAKETSDEAQRTSMGESDAAKVIILAKPVEPSLPPPGIHSSKATAVTVEEVFFHGDGVKVGSVEAGAGMAWKESIGGAVDRLVVEIKETASTKNAQVFLLLSTFLFTTLLAILLHHYNGKLLQSSNV